MKKTKELELIPEMMEKMGSKKGSKKGKKKSSPWIMHVKSQAKKLGIKYGEALKDKRTKASYKK